MHEFLKGAGAGVAVSAFAYVWAGINQSAYESMSSMPPGTEVQLVSPATQYGTESILLVVAAIALVGSTMMYRALAQRRVE